MTGLEREKFMRDHNQRATNNLRYYNNCHGQSKSSIFNKKIDLHIVIIVVGRWYHESATENFLKHLVFDREIFEKGPYFPEIIFIYKTKLNTNILNQVFI